MDAYVYRDGRLQIDQVSIDRIADRVGTPFYCYSATAMESAYRQYQTAFADQEAMICYAVKANSNQAVIRTFAALGAGADIVSEGELRRALLAGVPPSRVVFSGVGKTRGEMAFALKSGVKNFNVESEPELLVLSEVASGLGLSADVSLRVNPDVDAKTHAKISTGKAENKFGVPWDEAPGVYARAKTLPGIDVVGIDVHIGSQLTDLAPYEAAFTRIAELVAVLRREGHNIRRLDLGGGLGVVYREEVPPSPADYAALVKRTVGHLGCLVVLEPGRSLVANAGLAVASVLYVKKAGRKTFVILDIAMNDLIRPALYDAWMNILPVAAPPPGGASMVADFVGPVCESADSLAFARETPVLRAGDRVVICSAGAYGAVMSSTYNTRLLVPEVMVRGDDYAIIRPRPQYDDLIGLDELPHWQLPLKERSRA